MSELTFKGKLREAITSNIYTDGNYEVQSGNCLEDCYRLAIQDKIDLFEEIYNSDQSAIQIVANLREEIAGLKSQLRIWKISIPEFRGK